MVNILKIFISPLCVLLMFKNSGILYLFWVTVQDFTASIQSNIKAYWLRDKNKPPISISAMPVPDHLRQLREKVESLKPVPTGAHGAEHIKFNVPNSLSQAQYVYVRKDGKSTPLQPPYDGPYRVLERGPKHFKLQFGSREDKVSVDRLKIAITEGEVQVAQPPRRGRPPNSRIDSQQPQHKQNTPTQPEVQTNIQPSYAQVTSRGRTVKPPVRLQYMWAVLFIACYFFCIVKFCLNYVIIFPLLSSGGRCSGHCYQITMSALKWSNWDFVMIYCNGSEIDPIFAVSLSNKSEFIGETTLHFIHKA